MTYRYWNGERWCPCSQEAAAIIRAQGRRVIERADAIAPVVVVPAVTQPPAAEPDLTDEDLERLTAPNGEE